MRRYRLTESRLRGIIQEAGCEKKMRKEVTPTFSFLDSLAVSSQFEFFKKLSPKKRMSHNTAHPPFFISWLWHGACHPCWRCLRH